ncbi:MAG: GDPmannose 4,6-dehydratase [Solirubrobacteraceae bacterium]|jgi:GDPmannose 4,6-dehydratase|nr:GDPmannose 4,6-dehydratase [Solirubrobacteraceae bacterium]
MPRALITGVTGQDGSYLAELLLEKGYEVFGIVRGSPGARYANLERIRHDVTLLQGDLLDQMTLLEAINRAEPDELYNLAATSFVPASWHQPVMTAQFTAVGVTAMVEAIRITKPGLRLYQASSSEIFGATSESPQNELTPFRPHNPYGVAKLYGHLMLAAYRERYGMHLSSGIAYNHESPRRPTEFVTRKVTRAAAAIKLGLQDELRVGDLRATRDWGHASDFVEAMWLMLQQQEGGDYVIATGRSRSVGELIEVAFARVGISPDDHVVVDPEFLRPHDPVALVGDPSKAHAKLGWTPRISFEDMIGEMVECDLALLSAGASV